MTPTRLFELINDLGSGHHNTAARGRARRTPMSWEHPSDKQQTEADFDAEYEARLAEAQRRAGGQGRNDVVDYLSVRAANDRLREAGVEWLMEVFAALAGAANRAGASVTSSRTEAARFRVGNSTMVGPQLTLRLGVRALTVEAGWPRAPRDGIVRGGGLACARVSHFGNTKAGEELLLVQKGDADARWLILEETGGRADFLAERARRHLDRLLG
jgi:hypothetical protein